MDISRGLEAMERTEIPTSIHLGRGRKKERGEKTKHWRGKETFRGSLVLIDASRKDVPQGF